MRTVNGSTHASYYVTFPFPCQNGSEHISDHKLIVWHLFSVFALFSPYQRPSSAHPSALSSPVAGSPVHFGFRLSPFLAPVFLSSIAWHPPQPAFSHTSHTGWRLSEDARGEQR